MSDSERRKRSGRRNGNSLFWKSKTEESPALAELVKALKELEKEGKLVEVQVCPKCKSPRVRRVKTMSGDLWSHLGMASAEV